jgi:hypothetical protein
VDDTITIRFYEELNDFLHYSRRKKVFRAVKFILDVHLGTLARYLRMTGFDAANAGKFTGKGPIMKGC